MLEETPEGMAVISRAKAKDPNTWMKRIEDRVQWQRRKFFS
jgi:hypothetical protein